MVKVNYLSLLCIFTLSACGTPQADLGSDPIPATEPVPVVAVSETTPSPSPTVTVTPTPTAIPTPAVPKEMPAQIREDLAPKLISAYVSGADKAEITAVIDEIASADAASGGAWEQVLDYWDQVNREGFTQVYDGLPEIRDEVTETGINTTAFNNIQLLPEDLPTDDSLCFVVLGFQLNADGSLRQEAIDRLITVTGCLQEYPNAHILLTGGPTASGNPSATEAGAMADWLVEHGIEKERLIVENRSMITYDNAVYSYALLREDYPQIQNLVIVSSAYHIPLGSILFEAQCLLRNSGSYNAHVIANVGCVTDLYYNFTVSDQAKQVRGLLY